MEHLENHAKFLSSKAFWGVMMDSVGGMNNGFEAP